MASVLKLTKTRFTGVETDEVDFVGDAAYHITAWSPAVAERRAGVLGGRGPYEDVEEEMTITISGPAALSKLQTLMGTLDQAARWARGEPVGKVLFRYQPSASGEELKAVVLGGGEVELPPNFALTPTLTVIDPVVVRFQRSALWLGDDEVKTDTTAGNPEVAVATGFVPLRVTSPIAVKIEGLLSQEQVVNDSFVLVSSGESAAIAGTRIYVAAAEGITAGNGYTVVTDTANLARGNNVLRLTPTSADYFESATLVVSSSVTDQSARRWGVFVNYRNNSATTSWRLRVLLWNNYNANGVAETREFVIPAGVSKPTWAFVGAVTLPDSLERLSLSIAASAAAGTLDIDDIVLMAMDYPDSDQVIAVMNRSGNGTVSTTADLVIDHRLLERLAPAVYVYNVGSKNWWPYQGDATLYMREGCVAVAVAWLATGNINTNHWRATTAAGAVQAPSIRVTRAEGFLTPG